MKQTAKDLILLALWLVCNQYIYMDASVQLHKNISCLLGKEQAGTKGCCKTFMRRRSAFQQKTSVNSAASAALAAFNARQRQLLAGTGRAVLPIRASPSDLQVLSVTDRQVAGRQQLFDLGHCSKNLHIPAGESRGLKGCFFSAVTIAGSKQGTGLLCTIQIANRLWPLRRDVDD